MPAARDLQRDHRRWQPLIDFARREGWHVARMPGGHLKFLKPGGARIYTSVTASDTRAGRIARAPLGCAVPQALPAASDLWATTGHDLPQEARRV
jgi:hypothetical protein